MHFRFRTGLVALLSVMTAAALSGCKKESTVATAPPVSPPAAEPAEPVVPAPPPPYKLPDKLPVRATLTLVKQDDGAAIYKATFARSFTFDPVKATLALDINTVGWAYNGRIVITNKNDSDSAGAQSHEQLYPQPPTTDQLDLPEEHLFIGPTENRWIKEGGITLLIRNAEGADAPAAPPKILTVDLVEK